MGRPSRVVVAHLVKRVGCLLVCGILLAPAWGRAQVPVRWSTGPAPPKPIAAGQTFSVTLIAEIDPGWKLYAITQEPGGPVPTTFRVGEASRFELVSDVVGPPPERAHDPNFDIETEFHEDAAVFQARVRPKRTAGGRETLTIEVGYQTCNDRLCLPPTTVPLSVAVAMAAAGGAARPATKDVEVPPTAPSPPAAAPAAAPTARVARVVPDLAADTSAGTLGAYLWLAAAMGALSLLTPCVFPMVPITVSYFTGRAARRRSEAVAQAAIYGLGIILTFTALGFTIAVAFGASGLNRFAANPWLNLGVTALFVAFAFSLFGIFDLALPSSVLTRLTNAGNSRSGRYGGTMLMGLAFTLTSFTCTAPFLGTLLVVASQGSWQWPLAGMLAFSGVFALPFVVLALAPQLVASLPRSGGWLIAVKATMGLLELAAAMKFVSNADLVWHWGIFTRDVVIVSWVVIAAVLVLYLAGALPLGHAPRLRRPGLSRAATAVAVATFAIWLLSGLTGKRLGEVEAFLPPADLAADGNGELRWIVNDYDAALRDAARDRRPVFVDFTGYTCTNCRWMEANMFPRPEVARELGRYVRVRLYTDGRGEAYQRYQRMPQQLFGTVALPYYAIFSPDGEPVVAFSGLTRDSGRFVSFLRRGLAQR